MNKFSLKKYRFPLLLEFQKNFYKEGQRFYSSFYCIFQPDYFIFLYFTIIPLHIIYLVHVECRINFSVQSAMFLIPFQFLENFISTDSSAPNIPDSIILRVFYSFIFYHIQWQEWMYKNI